MSLGVVSLLVLFLDQVSKLLVMRVLPMGQSTTVIPGYLYLTYIQNPGAAFGFMANSPSWLRVPFFLLITVGAALIVHSYQRFIPKERWVQRLALGLIWGGAMGNFVDRVLYRRVVDFIDVRFHEHQWFPYIFNFADSCITVGLILLVLAHLGAREKGPSGAV